MSNRSPFKTTDLGPTIYFTGLNIDFLFHVFLDSRFLFYFFSFIKQNFSITVLYGNDTLQKWRSSIVDQEMFFLLN